MPWTFSKDIWNHGFALSFNFQLLHAYNNQTTINSCTNRNSHVILLKKVVFFYFRKSLYDQLTTNRQVSKKHMFLKKSVHLVCTNYADLTDEKKFIQMAPSGNVSMHCPLGTAFVAADCGCTKFIEILPSSNLDGRRRLPLSFISLT